MSFKGDVELVDFGKVVNSISPDNGFDAKLELINDRPYLVLEGFEKELLINQNSRILKRNVLHPSLNLSLFSMGYASDYLLEHYKNGTLGDREVDILENVYLFVFKEIINPLSLNNFSVNDHAISERIQFISLFSTYIKKNYPEKKVLLNALSKDINICAGFLLNKKFFTWQTNHGIMQLRSLAQLASVIKDEKLKESILNIFDKRLMDIIPYYIGPDGAIYESASEYWIYIFNQFTKITEIKIVEQLKSVDYLRNVLRKSKYFIHAIAANDGFLQGLGDSYSTHIFDTIKDVIIPQNRYFCFSNEFVGANWSVDNNNFNVLFVSLHTPPNVHKLPEDLAVYLYFNQPVFSNTGTFSYDESMERLFFKTEKSQSTVNILNQTFKEPINSKLTINNFRPDENILTVIGEKHYQDNKSITRYLEIDPTRKIHIRDYTNSSDSLIAYYNVHPKIKIKKISDKQILLQTPDSINFSFISNCVIGIIDGIISEKKEGITTIQRLQMIGNPIETTIVFPEMKLKQSMKMVTNNTEENNRMFYAKKLESQYENLKYYENTRKLVMYRSIPVLLFLVLFVSVCELFVLSAKRRL
ncbi:MAG TPA: heparinase II/III family protein [Ignavibacteria bacterium]